MKNTKDLLTKPLLSTLLKMSFSMSFGVSSIIGFNLIDTYFVGKLGTPQLSALSLTLPVVMICTTIAMSFSSALTSIVSRSLGAKEELKAKYITTDGLIIALMMVGVIISLGLTFLDEIFLYLGASDLTLPLIREYMTTWFWGMIFITIPMASNGAIRAVGDMKTAALIMVIAAVFNIILDPIFIFGFGPIEAMGLKGAALATVIARSLTFILSLWFLIVKYDFITFEKISFSRFKNSFKELTKLTIPIGLTNSINPIVFSIMMSIVAHEGIFASSAYGIVTRIESVALIFMIALSSSMGPLVGQNFGANKIERVERALYTSFALSLAWATLIGFINMIFPEAIMSIFTDDRGIIEIGGSYLSVVPLTYGFLGIRFVVVSSLNAMGKPFVATFVIFISIMIIQLPTMLIGMNFNNIVGLFYAQGISYLIAGIFCYFMIMRILNEIKSNRSTL